MRWNIWCLNEQNAQTTKTVKEFSKGTFNSMAHQQSPTKAQTQNDTVLLLPCAEY